MEQMIEVIINNTGEKKMFPLGTSLAQIANKEELGLKHPVLGALVNNKIKELTYILYKPKTIQFFDVTHPDGMRMYQRSLSFVLIKAVHDLYPKHKVSIEHSVSKGFYCEISGIRDISIDKVFAIGNRMREIIALDLPFIRKELPTNEALELFRQHGYLDKVTLLQTRPQMYTSVYFLNDLIDYFYGFLVPSTQCLPVFDLNKYYEGMLLMFPQRHNPLEVDDLITQNKMFDIFQENKDWGEILGVSTIGQLNNFTLQGKVGDIIKISEALHEKKVGQIADKIYSHRSKIKIVLISGPSSSGKTTFCKRLDVQLKVLGMKPVLISLDNYFVDREHTPRDEKGDYDFEALEALDVDLFNQHLLGLLEGKEVEIPRFSFETGKRFYNGDLLKIEDKTIILIEGIHGLNPKLTSKIKAENKFKIYVSALTSISFDSHNRVPTTDNRLIRRMVRDFRYRKYSALNTLKRWDSVRRGEDKNIFPFQEEADIMFNSALLFELGVLKPFAEPLLKEIHPIHPEYAEATRLLKFFSFITPIPLTEVPPTSLIREFLGGSSFDYH